MEERLVTAVIVVVGVPAVLVGYILLTERAPRAPSPSGARAGSGPGSGSRPALAVPGRLPHLPDDQHDRPVASRTSASKSFVGLDNYSWFFSERGHPRGAPQQRPVGRLPDRRRGRPRPAHRGPRRPGALRDGREVGRSSCRWRSASSRPAIIWRFMYQYRPPGIRADRDAQRGRRPRRARTRSLDPGTIALTTTSP